MHIFYLHGFASSAKSTKAAYFAARFREHGITLHTPDFNEPDFPTLTITRMIDQVTAAISALPAGPIVLIGSSLGAFVAVQTAVRLTRPTPAATGEPVAASHPVERMVLLAPALDFSAKRTRDLGDRGLDEWKTTGQLNVFHYGFGRLIPVHYDLYSDACGYDCVNATLTMPIQIFQGRQDTAVDPALVERWARARANVELHLLDDDHQLARSLDHIWREVSRFLAID
ncbi:MAG TPA: YqiA/YcfP family alpha/beta fold hydrolase [Vicinamibacterales bacterium]|nr:YqiA/YcfP family alpha/beta fold hydrolase [Vicinamibacterales bacterium]